VDRKALPAPEDEAGAGEAAYVAPRNEIEQAMCEVWQEVLKRERVGIEENFFSLGGDSILSIRVVSMLKARGIGLKIKDIFQYQTIEQLAQQVHVIQKEGLRIGAFALLTEQERESIAGEECEDVYPMSALQAGMVFHTQMEQFTGTYHDIMAEYVKCAWNREYFELALDACIREQPVLRTCFRLEGDRPLQKVYASMPLPLDVIDLRGKSTAAQDQYVQQWMEERKRHVFNWEQGPLFHVRIFRRTDESFEFVMSFHHAILDGWSRTVLNTTLYQRYERLLRGEMLEPVQVDCTYREFIALEQQILEDAGAKAYFMRLLGDAPARQLPRLKPAGKRRVLATVMADAFRPLSGQLIALARQLGVPVQAVLLAGHFKVLSVMNSERRAVSCVTHTARPETAGAERSLGMFLNSLPVSVEVKPGTWRELIEHVTAASMASMEYRSYPMSRIQQDVDIDLNEISFNYTHFHVYRDIVGSVGSGLEVIKSFGFERGGFDLLIDVPRSMNEDNMELSLVYNTQVFDGAMIERLAGYYVKAFEHMLADGHRVHHLQSLLSDEEMRQVLVEWNNTDQDYSRESCIHELFESQAARSPESTAVIVGDEKMSYGELNRQANQLAHYLQILGVRPDARVAIAVERGFEMIVGLLAVWKAGGAYVPLNPAYPTERLNYIIEDCAPAVLMTQSDLRHRFKINSTSSVIDLTSGDRPWNNQPETNPDRPSLMLTSKHLAYVIYTSGSTGKPKGVMIEHHGICNLAQAQSRSFSTVPDSRILQFAPFSFDAYVWEIVMAFSNGAALCFAPKGTNLTEDVLQETIQRNGVTHATLPPAFLASLQKENILDSVQTLIVAGEALSNALAKRWVQKRKLINAYGPTEATVCATMHELQAADENGNALIGKPIANTRMYVLDGNRKPVPVGVAGELYISGVGVARGYLNRGELNAASFFKDPFVEVADARMYKTGDLGRWLPDGTIEFLGRNDFQIKIRGFRVELGEIETRLAEHPEIKEAVVIVREDVPGEQRLVAYVSLKTTKKADVIASLRRSLEAQMPDFMMPGVFVVVDKLPQTVNGKVDRHALPAPTDVSSGNIYVPPSTEIEIGLAQIWADLLSLKVSAISRNANLFHLGGHSLMLFKLIGEIRNKFDVKIPIRQVMENPQFNVLAEHITDVKMKAALAAAPQEEVGADEMEVIL